MTIRASWLLCGIGTFGAYGVLAIMTPTLSEPPEISITLPAPDLSPKLSTLSGVWETDSGGTATMRVVVERIDETRATILLIGRNHPPGYPHEGWERVRARILRDGGVQWGYPVRFTLRVAEDGTTVEYQIERAGAVARATLKKVGAFVTVTGPKPEAALTKTAYQPGGEPNR
jgi:hypothetical protein